MGGVCSLYGREQEGRENFGGKTLKKQHYWKSYVYREGKYYIWTVELKDDIYDELRFNDEYAVKR